MTADAWVISIASAMATACIMSTDFVISSAGRKLMSGGLRSLAALEMPGRTMPGRTMPGQHDFGAKFPAARWLAAMTVNQ